MKKLEIIIRPEKLEDLKDILTVSGVTGMMISNIMGFGNFQTNLIVSTFLCSSIPNACR